MQKGGIAMKKMMILAIVLIFLAGAGISVIGNNRCWSQGKSSVPTDQWTVDPYYYQYVFGRPGGINNPIPTPNVSHPGAITLTNDNGQRVWAGRDGYYWYTTVPETR